MSVNTISPSFTSYKTQTIAGTNTPAMADGLGNSANFSVSNTDSTRPSFVQNVIQSLQNLGLNVSDVNTNSASAVDNSPSSKGKEALQTFLQNLSKVLAQGSDRSTVAIVDNVPTVADLPPVDAPTVDAPTVEKSATPTKFSGGTNFQYNVDLSQANLGDNLANVSANLKTALDNIGQFISSKVVFDLKILTEYQNSGVLAETNSALVTTTSNQTKSIDTSFVADSISGVDSSPNAPDATIYINLANIDKMSFSGTPAPDKYDLTSILTHEILHGLAFAGTLTVNPPLKTAYDTLILPQNVDATFVGRHAKTANSGIPIPLAPATAGQGSAYYHVAIPNDLMSASINKGEIKSISALDVGMLEDMGITVTGVLPSASKVQTTYNNPTANLQNLMSSLTNNTAQNSALQADFTHLVESLGGSTSSPTVNLQGFLTQLSANTTDGHSLQNDSGSIFSAAA